MWVGSLFAGVGGLDLGLERAGMEIAWQVEIDAFARRVLDKHWPQVPKYGDVMGVTGDELEPVDLICGGWPCQPFSLAGKRRASADERDMWPEFIRIIRRARPRWILGENVPGVLSAEDGRYFGAILRDLAESGYDAAWRVLRATDVGAPHLRERLFLVAHAQDVGRPRPRAPRYGRAGSQNGGAFAYAGRPGLAIREGVAGDDGAQQQAAIGGRGCPPESVLGRVLDGAAVWLDGYRWPAGRGEPQHDWEPFRTVSKGEVPMRAARLKAIGNAVLPQLAEAIGRQILVYEARREVA